MKVIADLEIHSKYARAVSSQMVFPVIDEWANKKGINLVGTGDFTHPIWLREIEANLEEVGGGVYKLKNSDSPSRFLLTCEVSCIYSHKGKGRRVHIFVYLPSLLEVHRFNKELTARGANLFSDGRPIIGLTLAQLAETALLVNPKAIIIPAHVWTPWFGFYGDKSGYDSLFEAFEELEKNIPAMETGLSSDPAMNWRIGELTNRRIVSFSDAHSPQKLGREATVFELPEISFENVRKALTQSSVFSSQLSESSQSVISQSVTKTEKLETEKLETENRKQRTDNRIAYTIEFYPEEGKYHYTGHRNCRVVYSPNETRKMGTTCPVCGRPLTVGVMSRVETLATQEVEVESQTDKFGVRWVKDKEGKRPPYIMMVPLFEILAEALSSTVGSQKVITVYEQLVASFESEFKVLLETDAEEIRRVAGDRVAEGIAKVRSGDIVIEPGYDGIFGKVAIWKEQESKDGEASQGSLFG